MPEFLTMRLYGPLVSWGDTAVGGTRPTADHPTRSAVLGLVAGALGLTRDDERSHRRLDAGLGLAVRAWSTGRLLRDYHTIETPHRRRGETYRTRGDELAATTVGTVLSQRDYRCDALFDACLWQWPQASDNFELAEIAAALRRPEFVPYLGRKSCPLALPLNPRLLEATDFLEAFRAMHHGDDEAVRLEREMADELCLAAPSPSEGSALYWEGDSQAPVRATQTVTRRDRAISRGRWQFTSREEHYALLPEGE